MPILACLISFLLACGLVGLLGRSEPQERPTASIEHRHGTVDRQVERSRHVSPAAVLRDSFRLQ